MQPVNDNRFQTQGIPVHQKIAGQPEPSSYSGTILQRGDSFKLPEDVVRLSASRSAILDTPASKKPSVAVSSVERKALQEGFSVYA